MLKNNTSSLRCNQSSDRIILLVLKIFGFLITTLVSLIFLFVLIESIPSISETAVIRLFTDEGWYPSENLYNLAPMLVASLLLMLGSLVISVPFGIGLAVFTQLVAPKYVSTLYRRAIELFAGIPSVIFGLWGLVVLVPIVLKYFPPGQSLLSGIIVLSLMILPLMALSADQMIGEFLLQYRNEIALTQLSRVSLFFRVILPSLNLKLFSSLFLQAGRALGETMAVLMVCGNIVQFPDSLFSPVRALTSNIALEMAYAMGDHRSALFVSGLLLLVLVLFLNLISDQILNRKENHGV